MRTIRLPDVQFVCPVLRTYAVESINRGREEKGGGGCMCSAIFAKAMHMRNELVAQLLRHAPHVARDYSSLDAISPPCLGEIELTGGRASVPFVFCTLDSNKRSIPRVEETALTRGKGEGGKGLRRFPSVFRNCDQFAQGGKLYNHFRLSPPSLEMPAKPARRRGHGQTPVFRCMKCMKYPYADDGQES